MYYMKTPIISLRKIYYTLVHSCWERLGPMWAVLECTSHYNEYERLDLLKCATHGPSRLLDNKLTLSLLYFELSIKVARMFINVSISISI